MSKREHKTAILEFERLERKDEAEVVTEVRVPEGGSEHWARIQAEVEFFSGLK